MSSSIPIPYPSTRAMACATLLAAITALSMVLSTAASTVMAQERAPAVSPAYGIPVSAAREGIPAGQSYLMRQGFSATNAYYTGDPNLYYFLHWEEFIPHNLVRRAGAVKPLTPDFDRRIGAVKSDSTLGEMSLDQLIADPRSRIQAFIVVRGGRVLYEQYPGMRDDDHHLWFSVSKTLGGLAVGLLEADGKIDVEKPIDAYLPEISATHWSGIRIIDILDMASGLDLAENEQSRTDRFHTVGKFFRIELGDTSDLGQLTSDQILFSAGEKGPPGEVFEYSSLNTKMLGLLAERVSGQRLADFLSERVWSQIGAEGDAQLGVNREGGAAVYGMMSSRLRDLARYGMLYTPSWKLLSDEQVVPASLIEKIHHGCRPALYERAMATRETQDPNAEKRCNSRQWDAVWEDGDMFKGGARGQGLYVSPARDLVVAWYSTTSENGWTNYARAIAQFLEP